MAHGRKAFLGKRVALPEGLRPACVIVEDGRVVDVLSARPEGFSGEVVDLGDRVVFPGLVDTHVHINEPGRTDWEGFETATRAAAAGGVTTLVDMPLNCDPVTTSSANLEAKLQAIRGKLFVDCGFWGGVTPSSLSDLEGLLAAGVLGVKSFLIDSGIEEFPPMSERDLRGAMPLLARAGVPYLIHAELEDGTDSAPGRTYRSFLDSRPRRWENRAIEMMTRLARETGCRVHIVHLSSAEALSELKKHRAEGVSVTVETCPHYLVLSAEEIADGETQFKCCPPIRERENREALWQGLREGAIDFVVSDHSPCTANLKLLEEGDFGRAWGGIASLQYTLPLVWTEASRRGFTLEDVAEWLSRRPAEWAGLGRTKGRIAKGADADFVVWDPEREFVIETGDIRFKNKVTPYLGRRLQGRVLKTYLRGEEILEGGAPRGQALLRR